MNKILIVLGVLALFVTPAMAGTISFNETVGSDTFVNRLAPTTNYDSRAYINIYAWHNDSRIYMNFNLDSSNFDDLKVFKTANIVMNRTYLRSDEDNVFRVKTYWVNRTNLTSALTWNNQACGTSIDSYPSYCIDKADGYKDISNTLGLIYFNVTKLVNSSLSEGNSNVTIMLVDSYEDGLFYHSASFDSLESTGFEPILIVTGEGYDYNTSISVQSPSNATYFINDIWLNFTPVNQVWSSIPCEVYLNDVKVDGENATNNTVYGYLVEDLVDGQYGVVYSCQNTDLTYTNSTKVWFYVDVPVVVDDKFSNATVLGNELGGFFYGLQGILPLLLGLIIIGGFSLLFIGFSEAIKGGFGK
jgi:hypothetical protein